MSLPVGATLALGEAEKINAAVAALAIDPHAPSEMTVRITLHVYREYPKHVTVGTNPYGTPITKVAYSKTQEEAFLTEPPTAPPAVELPPCVPQSGPATSEPEEKED